MVEQHRVSQRSPVAVTRTDRFGEPTQFPTRSTRPPGPGVVTPVMRGTAQSPVMDQSARRSTGTHLVDVDLVDLIEP